MALVRMLIMRGGLGDGRVAEDTAQNAHVDVVHHTDRGGR